MPKPLGAAFSHARAVGGGKDKEHRLANAYLRRRGHEPIGKGVLDQWRALSIEERTNEAVLRAQGISPAVARALAMRRTTKAAGAFAGIGKGGPGSGPHKEGDKPDGEAAKRLAEARFRLGVAGARLADLATRTKAPVKKADYHQAYIAAARAVLPPDVHDQLHRKARASAGGHGSRRAKRGRKDAKTGELLAASKALRASLKATLTDIDKAGPTLGELDAAGHAPKRRRSPLLKAADELVAQAFGRVAKADGEGSRGGHVVGHTKSGKPIYASSGSAYAEASRHSQEQIAHLDKAIAARKAGDKAGYAQHMADAKASRDAGKHAGREAQKLGQKELKAQAAGHASALAADKAKLQGEHAADMAAGHKRLGDLQAATADVKAKGQAAGREATKLRRANTRADRARDEADEGGAYSKANEKRFTGRVAKAHVLAQLADAYINAAYAPAPEGPGSFGSPTRTADALHAQEVIAATDWAIGKHGVPAAEARALGEAEARLTPGLMSSTATVSDYAPSWVSGLNLDIGSGYAREAGYIGLDLHPYDHGTLVHDVALGLPFDDATARSVRVVNVGELQGVNMTQLFAECARVLKVGGRMLYQGPPIAGGQPAGFLTSSEEMLGGVHRAVWSRQEHALQHDDNSEVVHKRERVEVVQPCRVLKKDAHQQLVYGVVLSPDEVDSQNDTIDASEIERTAHQFLRDARVVGHEHNDAMDGASVVESYIAPQDLTFGGGQYGPQTVSKGSWVLAVHVADPEHWQSVLDGAFTGFSVGGWGEREPVL